jgi:fructosamine-3-kinase
MVTYPSSLPDPLTSLAQLEEILGARLIQTRTASGGSINQAAILDFSNGASFFLKKFHSPDPQHFSSEFDGVLSLAKAAEQVNQTIRVNQTAQVNKTPSQEPQGYLLRVPRPLCWGIQNGGSFLVLEYISPGRPAGNWAQAGRALALLHQLSHEQVYGYYRDNIIGSSPQPNRRVDNWAEFFRDYRLGFQIQRARTNGLLPDRYDKLVDQALEHVTHLLPEKPHASLLHGDLWAGNLMWDQQHTPVLIDPAVYYGHNEADLAMTELFGGFQKDFYEVYHEVFPIDSAYNRRKSIYNLYHMLNHLNLFGTSYLSSVVSLLNSIG